MSGTSRSRFSLPHGLLTPFCTRHSFKKHFATYLEDDISSEDIEDMYREAHEKIREDPSYTKTDKADLAAWKEASKKSHPRKLTLEQRRERVEAKKAEWLASRE